jgi:hypothetical protein
MASGKRASMREGPLAALFRKTEEDGIEEREVRDEQPPEQAKPKTERVFDQSKIAALIDKRDPTRQAVTGDTLNSNAALGLSKGAAPDNTWGAMFRRKVESCWTNKPYAGLDAQRPVVVFGIKLKRDGNLEGMPVAIETPPGAYARAYQESALRAIIQCAPYNLPAVFFEEWKAFEPVFQERPL